jgi:hypothetical protein
VRLYEVPDGGQEERRAYGYEAQEEDDHEWVFVMHKVMAQAGARVRDAAIGELDIESSECGGDVDEEEAVEKAYGCIPAIVSS